MSGGRHKIADAVWFGKVSTVKYCGAHDVDFPAGGPNPAEGDSVSPEAVAPLLSTLVGPGAPWVAGVPLHYVPACPSTNSSLKEAAATSAAGTTLVTDDQTGGRGRLSRTWLSQPGLDLTFSVLLRPALVPEQGHLLALATAVAVAEVVPRT
jgi:hypothetical protein